VKVEMDIYYLIRSYHNDGMSIRTIAKTLGISRQTVKKYCDGTTIPGNRKEYHRDSTIITDETREFILSCFREGEQEGLAKQRHTAKRIYDRLVAEKGFAGGESTIRKAVNDLRKEHSVHSQADISLEYDPGDAIQIDWDECTVYLNGIKQKLYSFCGRLCYSCDIFVQLFYTQNLESFLEAQQRMFDYFGGVPNRLIFDNAKVAVREGFGKHAIATDGYAAFAAHYAFQTDFCNIASGNEKGLVENLVGYSRRNFMVPVPKAKSLEGLNAKLIEDCLNYRKTHKVHSRTISVNEAYHEELLYLHSVPVYRYDTSRTATPEVGDYSTVRFEKNNYSVPVRYLRRTVTVKGYADKVLIMYNGKLVATHDRLFGSSKTSYRLEHYIDLLERKPRSVFQAKPVRDTVAEELIDWGKKLPGGNAEMVKLLRLCVDHGEEKILAVKHSLPSGIIPTVDIIRTHLHKPAETNLIHMSNDIEVADPDLVRFDKKCGVS
jgi:transposase